MKGYFEKMKKFVLAFGIPVLAVASLIGSGYATWYFNTNIDFKSKEIGLEVTERAVGAKFQHSDESSIKLVLDQTKKNDGGKLDQYRQGVHFEGTFSESLIADDGDSATTPDEFIDGTVYEVTTTITIPSVVAKYVDFNFTTSTPTDGKTSSATTGDLTLTRTKEFKYTDLVGETKNTFDVFKISDVTVAYATESSTEPSTPKSKEPSRPEAYENMKRAVNGQSISISFNAEIVK